MLLRSRWHFRQMHPGEMNVDPIEAEFFSTEALGGLADALVREAIQNSLDARRPGERLTVRIRFSSAESALQGERGDRYLRGLRRHLEASRSGISAEQLPAVHEPLSFITIEDFGTRGLRGDPRQTEDSDVDGTVRTDFFYFWRNIGRSRKHAQELGRWGLGKTVFQAASRINSFFALTVRADDGRRLLLGQSVLKIHRLDGQRFYPYGYYGRLENEFALPIEAPDELDDFERDFALERGEEPGLSVVLPYPDADLTPPAVLDSVVRYYFMPILSGDLVVEIVDRTTRRLEAQSLPHLFDGSVGEEQAKLQRMFALARWGIGLSKAEHAPVAQPPENVAPRWQDDALSAATLHALRARFDAGRPIAVTVPVWVKPAHEQAKLSTFEVYLERDDTLDRADEHFVRDGITVAGVRAGLPRGTRALVFVRDHSLSTLLGDSENPAHTEWQERSPKFKDRYRHGAYTLRYVKNAPREILRLLTRRAEGRDYALLKQLFALAIPTEDEVPARTAEPDERGSGEEGDGAAPETVGKDRLFALQRLRGGFRVKGVGNRTPASTAVFVAYEVRRGNPFRQYHPLDFDLTRPPIEILTRHATITAQQNNVLVLRAERSDFELTVRGFDPHRDLRVRVVPAEAERAS